MTSSGIRSIEFTGFRGISTNELAGLEDCARPEIEKPIKSFVANIDRVRYSADVPGAIAHKAIVTMALWQQAKGDPEKFIELQQAYPPTSDPQVVSLSNRCVEGAEGTNLGHGLKAILDGAVIASWTAFECLATDLWIAMVDSRPGKLGARAFAASRRSSVREQTITEADQTKRPTVPIDLLVKYSFDLRRVGYVQWREKKYDFNSLEGLRHAYKAILFFDAEKWFTDPDLPIIEAVRHVLVHRGGQVDPFFEERQAKFPELASFIRESRVEIIGPVARRFVESSIRAGSHLVRNVSNWLEENEDNVT